MGQDEATPLHYACWNGHKNVVEMLVSKGAAIEARTKVPNDADTLEASDRYFLCRTQRRHCTMLV